MPDISMCNGGTCPLKEKCYRYTATPSQHLQSYFGNPPYNKDTESCDYFWDNSERKSKIASKNPKDSDSEFVAVALHYLKQCKPN